MFSSYFLGKFLALSLDSLMPTLLWKIVVPMVKAGKLYALWGGGVHQFSFLGGSKQNN